MLERTESQVRKEVEDFLGRPPREKAAIRNWKGLQSHIEPDYGVCCVACGSCIQGEFNNPVISFFLDSLKSPAWSIAQTCNGFDGSGDEVQSKKCFLHIDSIKSLIKEMKECRLDIPAGIVQQ